MTHIWVVRCQTVNAANSADHRHVSGSSDTWYKSGLKSLQVIIHDSELTEISDVIDVCERGYWSCDSRRVCRRSPAVTVTHSDPVGTLVCLGILRSYTLFVCTEGVGSAWNWTVMV